MSANTLKRAVDMNEVVVWSASSGSTRTLWFWGKGKRALVGHNGLSVT